MAVGWAVGLAVGVRVGMGVGVSVEFGVNIEEKVLKFEKRWYRVSLMLYRVSFIDSNADSVTGPSPGAPVG